MLKEFIKKFIGEEKNIEWLVILSYCILFYFDLILFGRLKILFLIILIIWTYIIIIKFIKNNFFEWLEKYYNKVENKKEFMNKLKRFSIIIINIYLYRSLVWYIFLLQKRLFFLFRRINLVFINYRKISKYMYLFVSIFILDPIKFINMYFYILMKNLLGKTLIEIFIRRVYGLIFSVIFFTPIINYILLVVKGKEILLVYLIFVIVSVIVHTNIIEVPLNAKSYEIRDFSISQKFKENLAKRKVLGSLIELKLEVSILGIIIGNIIKLLLLNKEKLDINDNKWMFFKKIYRSSELEDVVEVEKSIRLRVLNDCIRHMETYGEIAIEIKNKMFLAINYYTDWYLSYYNICCLMYCIDKFSKEENKLIKLKKLYKLETDLIKRSMFFTWDVERYIGIKENYIYVEFGDYVNGVNYSNVITQENWYLNEEKCLDFENDFEKILNIIIQIQLINYFRIDGLTEAKLIDDYFDIDQLHISDLVKYEIDPVTKWRWVVKDASKLFPYMQRMYDNSLEWRKEWEKEWEEGKRSYEFKEQKEIRIEYKWEDIEL